MDILPTIVCMQVLLPNYLRVTSIHSSREGVRTCKQTTTKLSEVTSNVLNGEYHNGIKREASISSSDLGTLSKRTVTQLVVQEAIWMAVKRTFLLRCYK